MKMKRSKRPNKRTGRGRQSAIYFDWREDVFKRDGYKCQHCGTNDRLTSHHVVPWDESEELRFEVSNGLTLCAGCHTRLHNPHKGYKQVAWNTGLKTGVGGPRGRKLSEEQRLRIVKMNTGRIFTEEHKRKLRENRTPENIEANKIRLKGRTWQINPETGKRVWVGL